MAEFVGLLVEVSLLNKERVEGVIEAVSPETELLLLSDAGTLVAANGVTYRTNVGVYEESGRELTRLPRLELSSDQISAIEVVSGGCGPRKSVEITNQPLHPIPPPASFPRLQPKPATSSDQFDSPLKQSKGSTPRKPPSDSWSRDDVRRYQQEEFDFQAALGRFDKAKIFEEIRAQDGTRPEERLVAHNVMQRKLRHDQNVLESRHGGFREEEELDRVVMGASSLALSERTNKVPFSANRLASVDQDVFSKIENYLRVKAILGDDQIIENGGRSLAAFLSAQLPSHPQLFTRGVLLVLASNRTSLYALAAARVFLNRGIQVNAFLSAPPSTLEFMDLAVLQFQAFGGRLTKSNTQPCSLVISSASDTGSASKAPVCALTAGSPALWNVRFGLPHDLPKEAHTTVVCDLGWPPQVVNLFWKSLNYQTFFDSSSSFSIIKH